jgi:hypothetical protein
MVKLSIIVRFSFEGIHSWPAAPQDVPEAYLVHPHRHLFAVEATKRVDHEERAIEFIALRREMLAFCRSSQFQGPHTLSCETMAFRLLTWFGLCRCSVTEDSENGALVEAGE